MNPNSKTIQSKINPSIVPEFLIIPIDPDQKSTIQVFKLQIVVAVSQEQNSFVQRCKGSRTKWVRETYNALHNLVNDPLLPACVKKLDVGQNETIYAEYLTAPGSTMKCLWPTTKLRNCSHVQKSPCKDPAREGFQQWPLRWYKSTKFLLSKSLNRFLNYYVINGDSWARSLFWKPTSYFYPASNSWKIQHSCHTKYQGSSNPTMVHRYIHSNQFVLGHVVQQIVIE